MFGVSGIERGIGDMTGNVAKLIRFMKGLEH